MLSIDILYHKKSLPPNPPSVISYVQYEIELEKTHSSLPSKRFTHVRQWLKYDYKWLVFQCYKTGAKREDLYWHSQHTGIILHTPAFSPTFHVMYCFWIIVFTMDRYQITPTVEPVYKTLRNRDVVNQGRLSKRDLKLWVVSHEDILSGLSWRYIKHIEWCLQNVICEGLIVCTKGWSFTI